MTDLTPPLKKTALNSDHVKLRAKMIPFGDWSMPVSYSGVLAEHKAVRSSCGLFDVSHMGEVIVSGPDATKYLQYVTINDVTKLSDGGGQYSAILNESGGMVDDLIIYRIKSDHYFICANASNIAKDFEWFKKQSHGFNVSVVNESDKWSQIAVQGPQSLKALTTLKSDIGSLAYTSITSATLFGKSCYIARTGYTGEWGYEIYLPNEIASQTWNSLLETSSETGAFAIGLGARDTLRLEACYLLYGNDMNESVSPLEAGIAWATKIDKGDFIGRAALIKQKEAGLTRRIVAFKMSEDGIPRHGMKIYSVAGEDVGEVTSGSVLPTVGGAGGMALVSSRYKEGDEFLVDIRNSKKRAIVVKRPLYVAKVK